MEGDQKTKNRSSDIVEKQLIRNILSGEYAPGSYLSAEREMAVSLGVGRPTIREVIQRLERDGWVTVRKGHPAIINDYWKKGNLQTLVNIVQHSEEFSEDFVIRLLELRYALTPIYVGDAVRQSPEKVVSLLAYTGELDNEQAFTVFDWNLQKGLAALSHNPLYLLILNSFDGIYAKMATQYFKEQANCEHSLRFYQRLLACAMQKDDWEAEVVTRETMKENIERWRNRTTK